MKWGQQMPAFDLKMYFNPGPLESLKAYEDEKGQCLCLALVQNFLSNTPAELEQMSLHAESNPKVFVRLAHTLKSTAAVLGGVEMAGLLADLEIREMNSRERKEGAQRVHESFESLKTILTDYIEQTDWEKTL